MKNKGSVFLPDPILPIWVKHFHLRSKVFSHHYYLPKVIQVKTGLEYSAGDFHAFKTSKNDSEELGFINFLSNNICADFSN